MIKRIRGIKSCSEFCHWEWDLDAGKWDLEKFAGKWVVSPHGEPYYGHFPAVPGGADVYVFCPWFKFYFPLFRARYNILSYPKTKENNI